MMRRGSGKIQEKREGKKQTSLLSYLSVKSAKQGEEIQEEIICSIPHEENGRGKKGVKRMCPFYKKIPGTSFSVDAFNYGIIPGCTAYFLTHFHADHYTGLRRSFAHPLYCTQITGNLVQQQLSVSGTYVNTLLLNESTVIDDVEVTFLEANHCPGSVLILFKLKSGQNYLHTGDFRFTPSMLHYPSLAGLRIHQLYLDTTYCSPRYDFPGQREVVSFAVEKSLDALHSCPATLVVCGSYTIGKERVFTAIAEVLGVKVCVSKEKKSILNCLESASISDMITTDYSSSCLHVLPMGKINHRDLSTYLNKWDGKYSKLIAFKPTGWTHSGKASFSLSDIKPAESCGVSVYGIPYSEHSSYVELKQAVQGWRPSKIIPTVNNGSPHKRAEMQRTFSSWLEQPIFTTRPSLLQSKLV